MQLRPYQTKNDELLTAAFQKGYRRIICWLPTGSGKGVIMANIAHKVMMNGLRCLTVMRRRDLIFQTYQNYKKYYKLESSIIMGNESGFDPFNNIQIASIDTLSRRIKNDGYSFLKSFDVIIVDECHDTTSNSYRKLFNFLGDKIFVGFTATPFSVGKKPLSFWQTCIQSIQAVELMMQGFLVDFELYEPYEIDTSNIKTIAGDFDQKELAEKASTLDVIGNIVGNYEKYGQGRKTIGFAVNKNHSMLLSSEFCKHGIPSIHIDESTSSVDRKSAMDKLRSGEIKVLWNVNIASTGVDIPEAACGILARPTKSEILFIQQAGRMARICPWENKENSILIDHGGNCRRLGHPYDERQPCLSDNDIVNRKKRKDQEEIENGPSLITCKGCYYIYTSKYDACPNCGTLKPVRTVKEKEGELRLSNRTPLTLKQKLKLKLERLKTKRDAYGYKKYWPYFQLVKMEGEIVYQYANYLGLPAWLKKVEQKDQKRITDLSQIIGGINNGRPINN